MPDTAAPASSVESKAARCVTHGLGRAQEAKGDLGRDPERPLRADEHAEQVGPGDSGARAAEPHELAVGEHDRQAGDVVDGEAVLEAVRAARVLGDVAADRADLLARRVRRVVETLRRHGLGHLEVGHARLDDDALRVEIDLEDAVHPRERDHDALGDGQRPAG